MFKFLIYFAVVALVTAQTDTTTVQNVGQNVVQKVIVTSSTTENTIEVKSEKNSVPVETPVADAIQAQQTQEQESSTNAASWISSTTATSTIETTPDVHNGSSCASDYQRGAPGLISEVRELLPVARLNKILAHAIAHDPEVRKLRNLLKSSDFQAKIQRLHLVKEHGALNEYICQILHLDYNYYLDFIRIFLDISREEKPIELNNNLRKGINGLLRDLREALPRQNLRLVYLRLMATDSDLAASIWRIRIGEFRILLRAYRQRAEYREVFGELEKAGLSVRAVQQLVDTAFGWYLVDVGAEATLLNL